MMFEKKTYNYVALASFYQTALEEKGLAEE